MMDLPSPLPVSQLLRYYHTMNQWDIMLLLGNKPTDLCYLIPNTKATERQARTHGPLTRYAKMPVAHAPGMPGTFSPPTWASDLDVHHGTCVAHVPRCMPGSLTSGSLWSRCHGRRSRHSRRMRNPQFYVSGKRPMWRDIYTRHDRKITP